MINAGLKPCPFCGGGEYGTELVLDLTTKRYKIDCEDCGITFQIYEATNKAQTIKKWNRRSNEKENKT